MVIELDAVAIRLIFGAQLERWDLIKVGVAVIHIEHHASGIEAGEQLIPIPEDPLACRWRQLHDKIEHGSQHWNRISCSVIGTRWSRQPSRPRAVRARRCGWRWSDAFPLT